MSALNTVNCTTMHALDKAVVLNNQFQFVSTKNDHSNFLILNSSLTKSIIQIQIYTKGIVKLKELRPQMAPGPDSIAPTILRTFADQVAPLLQQIFQNSFDTGELPLDWQKANVSPIFKTGNRSEPANYRPVSITSIPCKLLEHIFHANIMRHLKQYRNLNNQQNGFDSCRSYEAKLALSVFDLGKFVGRQSLSDVVIMDFSNAFDLVPHERLLLKLHHFGITGKLHNWIQNFLAMTAQQVVLEGVSSSSMTVISGVTQGMVFDHLLFILYLNNLSEGLLSQVRLLADNCILCRKIDALGDCHELQKDINTFCN